MALDRIILLSRRNILEVQVDVELHAAQVDAVGTFLRRVKYAIAWHLGGDVVARTIAHDVLGAAEELHLVRLALREVFVEHRA